MGTLQKKLYHFYHMMAAFQERFAPAICAMTIGLIFVAYLFNYIENKTQADQQKDNLLLTLSEVKDQVELDMETGFYLTENPRAQKLLESTSTRKKSLLSIQILDRTGLVLFSTDRAAIGELSAYYVRQQIAAAVRSSNKSTTNLAAPWNS